MLTDIEMTKTERFEEMAVIHIDLIYNFVLHTLGREHDAQILVQEIYIKAYKCFDDFDYETDCKLWLLKITKETLVKFVLCNSNRLHTSSISNMKSDIKTSDIDSEDYVVKAIHSLPTKCRMIVILADVEKLSYNEISYIIGCPVKTVASKLRVSRQIIKRKLQNGFDRYCYQGRQSSEQEVFSCG